MWPMMRSFGVRKKLALVALVAMGCVIIAISSKKVNPLYPKDRYVFTDVCQDSMSGAEVAAKLDDSIPDIVVKCGILRTNDFVDTSRFTSSDVTRMLSTD